MTTTWFAAQQARLVAHRAVTEGVNLKYVEQMRRSLYAAADRLDSVEGVLRQIAELNTGDPVADAAHHRKIARDALKEVQSL